MRRLLLTLDDSVTATECGECRNLELESEPTRCAIFHRYAVDGMRLPACTAAETEALELELAAWEEP
jgi:hypothetical protein